MPERREWRVEWRREGLTRKARRVRNQAGAERLAAVLRGDFPNPDAYACCDGRDCNCQGRTLAEVHATFPALVELPRIESRPFMAWEANHG